MQNFKLLKHIPIGGLVSLAIDQSERFLLVTTHSGIGVFELETCIKVARSSAETYPEDGKIRGIAPFSSDIVNVVEYDFENELTILSKNGTYKVTGVSDTVSVYKCT